MRNARGDGASTATVDGPLHRDQRWTAGSKAATRQLINTVREEMDFTSTTCLFSSVTTERIRALQPQAPQKTRRPEDCEMALATLFDASSRCVTLVSHFATGITRLMYHTRCGTILSALPACACRYVVSCRFSGDSVTVSLRRVFDTEQPADPAVQETISEQQRLLHRETAGLCEVPCMTSQHATSMPAPPPMKFVCRDMLAAMSLAGASPHTYRILD
jgi:hypothetical protein